MEKLFLIILLIQLISQKVYIMIKNLIKILYKVGFSDAGFSYVYRRYAHFYKFFGTDFGYEKIVYIEIQRKPVIIVTMSSPQFFPYEFITIQYFSIFFSLKFK